jgi:hypothetical protein
VEGKRENLMMVIMEELIVVAGAYALDVSVRCCRIAVRIGIVYSALAFKM